MSGNNLFKEGDVVRLKSGGPNMTVNGVQGDAIEVTWFEDGKKLKTSVFSNEVLIASSIPEKG